MKGFLPLLAVLFIGLKLIGIAPVAAWSWWLVLLPVYGPLLLALVLYLVGRGLMYVGSRLA